MSRRRKKNPGRKDTGTKAEIEGAGLVVSQPITKTLEINYMPYAVSVIISRAIPEIDGFKPSHRKLLYTMFKMGLLGGARTKSANVVGQTMKLNPHGDAAIYETMVRLSRGYGALLHPYVDSKGNFGKAYSRDMAYAASRYTEVRLASICSELFRDIDGDTVDFVDNYDGQLKEPVLLPVTFPSVLVNANTGIAVGMASSICSFNLAEVCKTTAALIKDPDHEILSTLPAPDFPGGGIILYDKEAISKIYDTGRGGIRVRARYKYVKQGNCIEINEIPPTATVEAIIEKIVLLAKSGKVREISDIRDETDLSGLKITIDLKRGADPDKLMGKLFRWTQLEDSFSCNFNILINGRPKVMGVREILSEWTNFREGCIRRRTSFELKKSRDKLHLLQGLSKILLDIDRAVSIIRRTDEESQVVPNLMIGFGIDRIQAEYVAEIKLRHLNREYILKRTEEINSIEKDIDGMEKILRDRSLVLEIIRKELSDVAAKYGTPRKAEIAYDVPELPDGDDESYEDYPVTFFLTESGYFKKITPQSQRNSGEQKLKDGDRMSMEISGANSMELLFFTDRCQVYKVKAYVFDDMKASSFGEYIPAKLEFGKDEKPVFLAATDDFSGHMLFFYSDGKVAKVPLCAYRTKTNRKKLTGAYGEGAALVQAAFIREDCEFEIFSSSGRAIIFHTGAVPEKATRSTRGVTVMTLKRGQYIVKARKYKSGDFSDEHGLRPRNIPAAGRIPQGSYGEQLTL